MNNFLALTIISLLLASCIGKHDSNAPKASIREEKTKQIFANTDTLKVDLSKSGIHWKGTKMRGAGKHEGVLQLQSAYFLSENGDLKGGRFVANMTTIGVTDIPEHEPIPVRNLNNHLKSEDFFDVKNYPTSKFTITNIKDLPSDSLMISGNLTIKNITKNIEFRAVSRGKIISTKFTFDRFQWNIAYKGNWADKTLVDKDVELTINFKVN